VGNEFGVLFENNLNTDHAYYIIHIDKIQSQSWIHNFLGHGLQHMCFRIKYLSWSNMKRQLFSFCKNTI
jgi:hypothetical protein